ncbi:hypothetical protein SLS56_004843 [Neofusicoccum ribis]|uniref:RRM domain-containing protein n=1 Tax=Neofusicoccum ribis TaxID=45134 RepID=A0ABR3SV24_9PEZI
MPTPAETPTPSKPRRISSGVEIDRAGSPIPEEEQMDDDDADADDTPESKRIVIANIPPGTSESDLRQHLRAHHPIKLKHAIRPPKKSEAHVYALPPPALACGLAKVDLADAAAAARAARALDGSRLHRAVLVVRRYRGGAKNRTATAAQKRRAEVDQQLRECKRRRTGEAPAAADVAGGDGGGGDAAPQVYPFTFAVAAGAAGAARRDVDVSFEDISEEVEARLAEQAARRAEAKRKGDGAVVGRKRKRVSAEGVEEEAAACAAIAGMALVDGPKKRARGERRSGEGVVGDERGQGSGVSMARTRRRKEKRRERMEKVRGRDGEGEGLLDESPRPMKRTRVSGVDGAPS